MKTLIVFFVSILFVTPCFSQKDLLPVYPNEISYQNNRAYFNGSPFTGLLVEKKTNKKLGEFKNGYKNGLFIEYYANGKKKSEGNFIDGIKDGEHINWHENGSLKSKYFYSSGKIKDGYYTIYLKNGQKQKIEYFINGVKSSEGIYKGEDLFERSVLYYPEGEKESEGLTKNGIKDSIWTVWYKTGEKRKVLKYENGNVASVIYENTSLVTDIDDNVYHTIAIGSQVWMKENLKTTKYRNGDPIPNITGLTEWYRLITGAYCNYDNQTLHAKIYGRLYNGFSIHDSRNICPEGWHIPTVEEWSTLESYLGGFNSAGGKLKEIGTNHWRSPNLGASSSTNFLALPGGARNYSGEFGYLSQICYWWSMTNNIDGSVWSINYNSANFYKDRAPNKFGFSVRCIKD